MRNLDNRIVKLEASKSEKPRIIVLDDQVSNPPTLTISGDGIEHRPTTQVEIQQLERDYEVLYIVVQEAESREPQP